MTRSLLNTLSTFEIMLIFGGGSVVLAVCVVLILRRVVPDLAERQFEELADGLRVVFELLFALLLAFVIASVLDEFGGAQTTVGAEAAALSDMVRANQAFPVETQVRLNSGIGAYVNAAISKEWPAMRDGGSSPDTAAALETMSALYTNYKPTGAAQVEFYGQALSSLGTVATARRERLNISSGELPGVLRAMLILGAVLLLLLEYRAKLSPRAQALFMGILAFVVSTSYLLTIVLDYPFSGDVSVGYEPLTAGTLAVFAPNPPRTPQPDDRAVKLTPKQLEGVWRSESFGTIVLRRRGDEIRGVYRLANGSIRGSIRADGVFRGMWCEGPTRKPGATDDTSDAGLVEWRLLDHGSQGRAITGTWRYGFTTNGSSFFPHGGWDLRKLDSDGATDLERRIETDPPTLTCRVPR